MDSEINEVLGKKDVSFPKNQTNTLISPPDKLPSRRTKGTVEVRALKKLTDVCYEGAKSSKLTKREYIAIKNIMGDREMKLEDETIQRALMLNGLETNMPVVNAIKPEYIGFTLKLIKQIEEEYDCKTPSEKVTAQIAAIAHARALQYEEKLRDCLAIEYHSGQKNGFFSLMSKEVDRANRQYFTAIGTLRQIKSPSIQINVKANAAFVSKNQQVNINKPNNNDNENNEAE
jgi:hypothetical protein